MNIYLTAAAVVTSTGWAAALFFQLPCVRVHLTSAFPVGAELCATLACPSNDLDPLFKVNSGCLTQLE